MYNPATFATQNEMTQRQNMNRFQFNQGTNQHMSFNGQNYYGYLIEFHTVLSQHIFSFITYD